MPNKLPLFATVKNAYLLSWLNRYEYLKISRWWLVISFPILFLYTWLTWETTKEAIMLSQHSYEVADGARYAFLVMLPSQVFTMFICSSIAVAWHRLLLINEHIETVHYFRVDATVRNYFSFLLLSLLPLVPPLLIALIGKSENSTVNGVMVLLMVLLALFPIVALFVITRISVILPAKALNDTEVTIRDVWERTRGNFWRLFIGSILCFLPLLIITNVANHLSFYNELILAAIYIFQVFLSILITTPVALSFLSLSYKHFFTRG